MSEVKAQRLEQHARSIFFDLQQQIAIILSTGRVSVGLLAELSLLSAARVINYQDILREIGYLEGRRESSRTKAEGPFHGALLKGLWHKHYFCTRYLLSNIANELKYLDILEGIPKGSILDKATINIIAQRASFGAYERRHDRRALTGQWIVYEPSDQGNYYICIAFHGRDMETATKVENFRALDDSGTVVSQITFQRNA